MENGTPKTRETAIAIAAPFFNTGTPCRRNHISNRYTSTGNCVECMKLRTKLRSETIISKRRASNAIKAQDTLSYPFTVPLDWIPTFTLLEKIANGSDEAFKEEIRYLIHSGVNVPAPATAPQPIVAMNRGDLLAAGIQFDGVSALNYDQFDPDQDRNGEWFIRINDSWFLATDVMDCLHSRVPYITPKAKL